MTAASSSSMAAFSRTIALLYEAGLDPQRREEASQALRDFLEADEILFSMEPVRDRRRVSDKPHGRLLCLDISGPKGAPAQLLARREPHRPPFEEEHIARLALLRPHLERAEKVAGLVPQGVFARIACDGVVALMPKGLIVTDAAGSILWRNPTAADILASGDGLLCVDGQLRTARAFESSHLRSLIQKALTGTRGAMLVGRASGYHAYGIAAAPLDNPINAPLVLVAIKAMEREIQILSGRLGEMFGLTGAEERLAILLLNGHSLQSAAKAANKTLATVKSQLHGLLKKTGARGQSELMNVLLSLPSLI